MFTPDQNVPMASNMPANPVWPAAQGQMQAAPAAPTYDAGNPSFDAPLPPAPIGNGTQPAYRTAQPNYPAQPQPYPAEQPSPATQPTYADAPQPPGCPPGYICTPVGQGSYVPPPTGAGNIGWSVGAQPAQSYSPTDITGSVPGPYSDD